MCKDVWNSYWVGLGTISKQQSQILILISNHWRYGPPFPVQHGSQHCSLPERFTRQNRATDSCCFKIMGFFLFLKSTFHMTASSNHHVTTEWPQMSQMFQENGKHPPCTCVCGSEVNGKYQVRDASREVMAGLVDPFHENQTAVGVLFKIISSEPDKYHPYLSPPFGFHFLFHSFTLAYELGIPTKMDMS